MKGTIRIFLLVIIALPLLSQAQPCPFQVNLGNDTMICNGSMLTLDAEVDGASYSWSDWSSSPQTQVFFEGEYSVIVTKEGCEVKDTIYVGLKPALSAEFTYDLHGDSVPGKIQFTDLSSACDGSVVAWQWNFGDGQSSTERNPVHTYAAPGAYQLEFTVKDNVGSIQGILVEVVVPEGSGAGEEPEPCTLHADFNYSVPPQAAAGTIAFTDISSSCAGVITRWGWNFGDGRSSTQRNPVHTYTAAGNYQVILAVKDNTGAIHSILKEINVPEVADTTLVEPHPEPEPEPEPEPGPEPHPAPEPEPNNPGDTTTYTCNLPKPGIVQQENTLRTDDAYSYKWYKDGQLVYGATNRNIRVSHQGYYSVKVFDNRGCWSESDPFFFKPPQLTENEGVVVKCSPNPGHGRINIILSEVPDKPAKLTIYNMYGLQVFTSSISNQVNALNGVKLSKGMYMVEILVNGKRKTITAVVQ